MSQDGMHHGNDQAARLAARRALEQLPLEEAGGGEAEGFEAAEAALIEHASHGDQHTTAPIMRDSTDELRHELDVSGEADDVRPRDVC